MVQQILERSLYVLMPFVVAILIRCCNDEGGWHVHLLVYFAVARMVGRLFSLPHIQCFDSHFVVVRGAVAGCSFLPAYDRIVNY